MKVLLDTHAFVWFVLTVPFDAFWSHGVGDNTFRILPIEIRHAALLISLPFGHKDPFDRMPVAQAMADARPLVSCGASLDSYPVRRIW